MGWLKWFATPPARKVRGFPPADLPPTGDPDRAWRMLTAWWQATESDVSYTAATSHEVEALAERYGIVLPDDFAAYLRNVRPLDDRMDRELGSWWPVSRIRNLPDEGNCAAPELPEEGRRYLLFADFLIWSSAWAICCEPGDAHGQVLSICGDMRVVAGSFTDFVERYTTDWASIG